MSQPTESRTHRTDVRSYGAGRALRTQIAAELFGTPTYARDTPMILAKNISADHSHGLFTLSDQMVRYLGGKSETGTDILKTYVQRNPLNGQFYQDFLRMIWRTAPDTGVASKAVVTALGQRYGISQAQVYRRIENAEGRIAEILKEAYAEENKKRLLDNIARRKAQDAAAGDVIQTTERESTSFALALATQKT